MPNHSVCGLLDGKAAISQFLNNASDYMLRKYIEAGMPVIIEGGRWLAHRDNIEDFFRAYTRKRCTEIPNDLNEAMGGAWK